MQIEVFFTYFLFILNNNIYLFIYKSKRKSNKNQIKSKNDEKNIFKILTCWEKINESNKKRKCQKSLKIKQMGLGVQNRKDGVNKKKCSGPAQTTSSSTSESQNARLQACVWNPDSLIFSANSQHKKC